MASSRALFDARYFAWRSRLRSAHECLIRIVFNYMLIKARLRRAFVAASPVDNVVPRSPSTISVRRKYDRAIGSEHDCTLYVNE